MKLLLPLVALCALLVTAVPLGGQTPAQWQDVVRNLRHPDPETRLSAVNRLADGAYSAAAAQVAALVTDPDDRVQLAAIEAELSFFQADRIGGGVRVLGMGGSSNGPAQDAFEAGPLLRAAAPAPAVVLNQLLAAVRDENARVRFDAIHAFGFIAEPPLDAAQTTALAAELDHYDPIIRAATARVIARLQVSGAIEAVAVAMGDSNSIVRLYATEATGRLRDTKSAATLREQLSRARGDQLEATLLALARIGERGDIELFRQRLADRNADLRRAAVEGLGRAGDRDSIPHIEALLQNDKAPQVRAAAAFALHLLGQEQSHVIAPMLVLDAVNAQVRDYLFDIGRPAVPGIISTLTVATDERHRADLVQLIGYFGRPEDLAVVEALAADRSERVRRAVTQAMFRLKP